MNSIEQHGGLGGYGSLNGSMQGFLSEVQADLSGGSSRSTSATKSSLARWRSTRREACSSTGGCSPRPALAPMPRARRPASVRCLPCERPQRNPHRVVHRSFTVSTS
jgi:hypothetical protein